MIGSGVVAPLSKAQIEGFASEWRRGLGYRDDQAVNMLRIIELVLPQIYADFDYEVVDDHLMAGAEATTNLSYRYMRISASTYADAQRGRGRSTFTLAHEMGHLLLHYGKPVSLARGPVPAYSNPEWQADSFASAFLIPPGEARATPFPEVLAARFGTTPAAARVRLQKLKLIPDGPNHGGAHQKGR